MGLLVDNGADIESAMEVSSCVTVDVVTAAGTYDDVDPDTGLVN